MEVFAVSIEGSLLKRTDGAIKTLFLNSQFDNRIVEICKEKLVFSKLLFAMEIICYLLKIMTIYL